MLAWACRVECGCSTRRAGFGVWCSDAPRESCRGCAEDCVEHYRSTLCAWKARGESVESGLSTQGVYGGSTGSVERYRSTWAADAGLESLCGARVLHTLSSGRQLRSVWSDNAPHSRQYPHIRHVWKGRSPHFRFSPPIRIVWSDNAPHGPPRILCRSCVVQLCSTCQDPTLVRSRAAPHVDPKPAVAARVEQQCSSSRCAPGSVATSPLVRRGFRAQNTSFAHENRAGGHAARAMARS